MKENLPNVLAKLTETFQDAPVHGPQDRQVEKKGTVEIRQLWLKRFC